MKILDSFKGPDGRYSSKKLSLLYANLIAGLCSVYGVYQGLDPVNVVALWIGYGAAIQGISVYGNIHQKSQPPNE